MIGQQYSSEKVRLQDFEKLAEDAKLGTRLMRPRLVAIADRVQYALTKTPVDNPVAEQVSKLIRHRADTALRLFGATLQ